MTNGDFHGLNILVVEDEYLIADDIQHLLSGAGALVLGPASSVGAAARIVADAPVIDGALLDINLGGDMVFDVADALSARQVPFAFATGYDRTSIPDRFASVPRFDKPIRTTQIATLLDTLAAR